MAEVGDVAGVGEGAGVSGSVTGAWRKNVTLTNLRLITN